MKARRLTKYQARQVASLVEDSGYSAKEARTLVLEGFGEDVDRLLRMDRDERGRDEDRELAEGEARAQAREDRDGDDNAEVAWESPE